MSTPRTGLRPGDAGKPRHRKSSGRGKGGNVSWPLSGLLYCGCCGRVMHAAPRRGKNADGVKLFRYYQCSGRRDQGAALCPTSGVVDADWALAEVGSLLEEKLGTDEALARVREQVAIVAFAGRSSHDAEIASLRTRLAELERSMAQGNRNLALLPEERIPAVLEVVRGLERDRDAILGRITSAERTGASGAESAARIDQIAASIGRLHDDLTTGDAQKAHGALLPLVSKIVVHFRTATAEDRRRRRGNVRFVVGRLELGLSERLLSLISPACPTSQAHATLSKDYYPIT